MDFNMILEGPVRAIILELHIYTQAGGFLTGIAVINRDISQPPMKRGNTEKPRRPGKVSSHIVTMSLDILVFVWA